MLTAVTSVWILVWLQAAPAVGLQQGPQVTVTAVAPDLTLTLEDGRELRLLGVDVPDALMLDAVTRLRDLSEGKTVTLYFAETHTDRWRRLVAHVVLPDGAWLQGALLEQGLARVRSFEDNRAAVDEMLRLEGQARDAGLELWAMPNTRIKTPIETDGAINSFQIVEGAVLHAAKVRSRTYLNFGQDWKTDFTVMVPAKVRRQLEKQGVDLTALTGRSVRVRGWVKSFNGPMIELSHAEQLEIIDAPEDVR